MFRFLKKKLFRPPEITFYSKTGVDAEIVKDVRKLVLITVCNFLVLNIAQCIQKAPFSGDPI